MTNNDTAFWVSFEIADDTEIPELKRVLGQVAASVGSYLAGGFTEECVADWDRRLAMQPLPIFSFGEDYKDSLLWRATGNYWPESGWGRHWGETEYFRTCYINSIDSVGALQDFDKSRIPTRDVPPEEELNGFELGTLQFLVFRKESKDPDEGPVPGQLVMETGLPCHLLTFSDRDPYIVMGLDRFWTLVVQDVILQLHRRLRSRRTVIWSQFEDEILGELATLDSPHKLALWDFRLLPTGPFGVEKIDQALNTYEDDLRGDRLRETVVHHFESTTVR